MTNSSTFAVTITRIIGDGPPYYVTDDGYWRIQRIGRKSWEVTSKHFGAGHVCDTLKSSLDFIHDHALSLPPAEPQRTADPEPFDFTAIDAAADDVERKSRHLAFATSALADQVDAARQAGVSWTTIGVHLGLSKQGAQQRFGSKS